MSFERFKPLGDRLLVRRSKNEKSKGGVLLPDSAQEKPKQGEVLRVGPGATRDDGSMAEMEVKAGDRVLFGSFAGTEVGVGSMADDEQLLIMSEDDVLAVVE